MTEKWTRISTCKEDEQTELLERFRGLYLDLDRPGQLDNFSWVYTKEVSTLRKRRNSHQRGQKGHQHTSVPLLGPPHLPKSLSMQKEGRWWNCLKPTLRGELRLKEHVKAWTLLKLHNKVTQLIYLNINSLEITNILILKTLHWRMAINSLQKDMCGHSVSSVKPCHPLPNAITRTQTPPATYT